MNSLLAIGRPVTGSVNFFYRDTDDHGTWYLPAALNVPGIDGDYTQVGTLNRQREIMFDNAQGDPLFPDPKFKTLDLADGGSSFRPAPF